MALLLTFSGIALLTGWALAAQRRRELRARTERNALGEG